MFLKHGLAMPGTSDHVNSVVFTGGNVGGEDALERAIGLQALHAVDLREVRPASPRITRTSLPFSARFPPVIHWGIRERQCCSYQFFPLSALGLDVHFAPRLAGTEKEGG